MKTPAVSTTASPCINVCRMNDATGLCEGCWRTLDEISVWSLLDEPEKRDVLASSRQRRQQARAAAAAAAPTPPQEDA